MCAERSTWEDDMQGDAPPGERPFGTRPFGTRPFGTRPFGTRPFGTRPFGTRPFGTRPFGTRPFGTRPFGTRPFGTRPFGTRPFGTREDDQADGSLDPAAWSADISELFCAMSATVRLGARIVCDVDELLIPARPVSAHYLPRPEAMDSFESLVEAESDHHPPDAAIGAADAARLRIPVGQRTLKPRDHVLAVQVVVPNSLVRTVVRYPEVADALKQDIARALALEADRAFLHGRPGELEPAGITEFSKVLSTASGNALAVARQILRHLRLDTRAPFENPGWVFDPATLQELTRLHTAASVPAAEKDTKTLDATRLLELDGVDGGMLLGYPFVVTRAAVEDKKSRIYFSSDWSEAWIGAGSDLVGVDFSTDADFVTDNTIVKAVMRHDFVVRRPGAFTFTGPRTPK